MQGFYALHGMLQASKGNGQQLANILLEAAEIVSKSSDCKAYIVSVSKENEDAVWVTEVWTNKAAHDATLQAPEVMQLIGKAMPILATMPTGGQHLEVLGGLMRS